MFKFWALTLTRILGLFHFFHRTSSCLHSKLLLGVTKLYSCSLLMVILLTTHMYAPPLLIHRCMCPSALPHESSRRSDRSRGQCVVYALLQVHRPRQSNSPPQTLLTQGGHTLGSLCVCVRVVHEKMDKKLELI